MSMSSQVISAPSEKQPEVRVVASQQATQTKIFPILLQLKHYMLKNYVSKFEIQSLY